MGQQIVTTSQVNIVASGLVVPPGGTVGIGVDTDGTVKSITPAGVKASIGGGGNAWAAARQTVMDALVTGLTYVYIKPTNKQQATDAAAATITATIDAAIVGGGMTPAAGHFLTLTGVIYTDLTTQPHAWAARGRFATPSANFQLMGPVGAGTNDYAALVALTSYDATHLCLQLFKNGAVDPATLVPTSHVIDGNAHNYGISFDGTTYKAIVDDVVVGSTAVLTNLTSGNRVWAVNNVTSGDVKVFDLVYGYRQP